MADSVSAGNCFFVHNVVFKVVLDIFPAVIFVVTTTSTKSTQPNLTTIEVGFEAIMTLNYQNSGVPDFFTAKFGDLYPSS